MAKFEIAEAITGLNELGYANSPDDHGGETYAGIARKFWPNWKGWAHIDLIKEIAIEKGAFSQIDAAAKDDEQLQSLVSTFYKQNFWDANKLDLINDQQIANNVYDEGVNGGVRVAAKMLQRAALVTPDGVIGPQTIGAVNSGNPVKIYTSINSQRILLYQELAKKPKQGQFLHSWLSRIKPYQTINSQS